MDIASGTGAAPSRSKDVDGVSDIDVASGSGITPSPNIGWSGAEIVAPKACCALKVQDICANAGIRAVVCTKVSETGAWVTTVGVVVISKA